MAIFATGWKPDSRDYGLYKPSHHHLFKATPTLPTPNLLPFRSGLIWQSGFGMCTGCSSARSGQLWWAANGYSAEVLMSPLFSYLVGLAAEWAAQHPGAEPPASFADIGAEPGLEYMGMQNVGFVLEQDFPSPMTVGFNPQTALDTPSPALLAEKAYDARGLEWSQVQTGGYLRDAARELMVRRISVKVAMIVDSGVMANRGDVVRSINKNDPNAGGHDVTMLDATNDDYAVLDNWWRLPGDRAELLGQAPVEWGAPDGTWRISWDCLEKACVQALAFQGAALVQKAIT